MESKEYPISLDEQNMLLKKLEDRNDAEALRIKRYLAMPDLSRTPGSPLYELVQKVRQIPVLKDFDNIIIPEIVPVSVSFDLFGFAPNHPARSPSDTYYVNEKNILRTHDTVMWYYYLQLPDIKKKIAAKEPLGVVCYGKVYRKDEIDRGHMNIFHQMGGLYLVPDERQMLNIDDLKNALSQIVQGTFGQNTKFHFNVDTFPYTDPSLEVEVEIDNKKIEILGGGMPKRDVLKNFGLEGYNGWAFGFGLERLAIVSMELPDIRLLWSADERIKQQLKLGKKYVEVSKYPPITRDISFVVPKATFNLNEFFDIARDVIGEEFIEEMKVIDQYEDEAKFGTDKKSYTYRVVYRHLDRTLTNEEVDKKHHALEEKVKEAFAAVVR